MALCRIWTQLNCQDSKTTYQHWTQKLYPCSLETHLNRKQLPWLKSVQNDSSFYTISKSLKCAFYKTSVTALPQKGSTVTDCEGQSSLRQRHPVPYSTTPTSNQLGHRSHCWWGNAINSSAGSCQQHDVPSIAAEQWHQLNMTTETKAGHFLLNHTDQLLHHGFSLGIST